MAHVDLTPHLLRLARQAPSLGLDAIKRSLEANGMLITDEDLRTAFDEAGFIETATAGHFILGNDSIVRRSELSEAHMRGLVSAATSYTEAGRLLHAAVMAVPEGAMPTGDQWIAVRRAADRLAGVSGPWETTRKNAVEHMRLGAG